MALLTIPDLVNKFNSVFIGLFKDNVTNDIEPIDQREMVVDFTDSIPSWIFVNSAVDTTVDPLVLDAKTAIFVTFVGSASFATAKGVTFINAANLRKFDFIFEVTNVAGTLDFGAGSTFKTTQVAMFDPSTQVFTPQNPGLWKVTGTLAGSNWLLDFSQDIYL